MAITLNTAVLSQENGPPLTWPYSSWASILNSIYTGHGELVVQCQNKFGMYNWQNLSYLDKLYAILLWKEYPNRTSSEVKTLLLSLSTGTKESILTLYLPKCFPNIVNGTLNSPTSATSNKKKDSRRILNS